MNKFVRIIIKDKNNRFLVLKHKNKKIQLWNFPGGKVENDESLEDAAIREFYEETGSIIIFLRQVKKIKIKIENENWEGVFFFAQKIGSTPFIKEKNKFSKIAFKSEDEIECLTCMRKLLYGIVSLHRVKSLPQTSFVIPKVYKCII